MVINRQNIKRLKAVGLMALGLGIGSGGTLLLQQWTTDSMPVLKQGVAEQQLQEPACFFATAFVFTAFFNLVL